jgi:hypothetical protein
MVYCDADDVRLVCGVAANIISSGDIGGLIVFSDQEIDDKIGSSFGDTVPTRIQRLSALLTAIQIYGRPDLRFRLGQAGIDEQRAEKNLDRWQAEADEIFAFYSDDEGSGEFRVVQA